MRRAVGVFDPMDVSVVVEELARRGCSKERMSVVVREPSAEAPHGPADIGAHLDGLHLELTRDVGRVFVAGPVAELFAACDLGFALQCWGIPGDESRHYAAAVRAGAAVLAVEIDEALVHDTLLVMQSHARLRRALFREPTSTDEHATASACGRRHGARVGEEDIELGSPERSGLHIVRDWLN